MRRALPIVDPAAAQPRRDAQGRAITYLRISVTDRCNFRCLYCMPEAGLEWLPKSQILSYEEIAAIVRQLAPQGIRRLRITGGEPTIRPDLEILIRYLADIPGGGLYASALAEFLAAEGARVIAVSDSTSGLYDPKGIDVGAALAHKRETGSLRGLPGADPVTNEELVLLDCDVLAPCALEQVVTEENADRVKAKIVLEGANGPVTPPADEILEERGVLVLPDILANAGGVVVSYFEWVQGLQEYFWSEEEVNAQLETIVTRAFEEAWSLHEERNVSMRLAAYGLGVQRLADATRTRGLYP